MHGGLVEIHAHATMYVDDKEEVGVLGVELQGHNTPHQITDAELHATHMHSLTNSIATIPYYMLFYKPFRFII